MKYTNVYGLGEDLAEVVPARHSSLAYNPSTQNISWVKDNADSCIVVISKVLLVFKPYDGLTYIERQYLESLKGRVIYRGRGTQVSGVEHITSSPFYIYLFSFNGVQSTEVYNKLPLIIASEEKYILMEDGFSNILTETGDSILIE